MNHSEIRKFFSKVQILFLGVKIRGSAYLRIRIQEVKILRIQWILSTGFNSSFLNQLEVFPIYAIEYESISTNNRKLEKLE